MPLTISALNGSAMLVTTTPIVSVRRLTRLRPTALTRYPFSFAIAWMRRLVSGLTSELLRRALETVEWETLAARAMSLIEIIAHVFILKGLKLQVNPNSQRVVVQFGNSSWEAPRLQPLGGFPFKLHHYQSGRSQRKPLADAAHWKPTWLLTASPDIIQIDNGKEVEGGSDGCCWCWIECHRYGDSSRAVPGVRFQS